MLKKLLIFPILFILFTFAFINVQASETESSEEIVEDTTTESDDVSSYDEVVIDLENEIGEESTLEMLNRIKTEICELTESTYEELSTIIDTISAEYGVLFTDEQKQILIDTFQEVVDGDNSELFNSFFDLINEFWEWIKSLHSDSEIEIKPIEGENNALIESDGETVTVNIPTVKEVDGIVDSIIEVIKAYVFPEENIEETN